MGRPYVKQGPERLEGSRTVTVQGPREDLESFMGIGSQLRAQERRGWNIPETGYFLSRKQGSVGQ